MCRCQQMTLECVQFQLFPEKGKRGGHENKTDIKLFSLFPFLKNIYWRSNWIQNKRPDRDPATGLGIVEKIPKLKFSAAVASFHPGSTTATDLSRDGI